MKTKLFKMLAVFAAASMLLAACGAGAANEAPAETKVLRVWIQWGDNPQQIQTLFDKYTAETGIKVEVTAPLEEDKILPALTGSEPPDVLVLSGGDKARSRDVDLAELKRDYMQRHYHQPSDDLDLPIHYATAADLVRVNMRIVLGVANAAARPRWATGDFLAEKFPRP